jgi:hypothetical protein
MNFLHFWLESTVQLLANCYVLLVFFYSTKIEDHGGRQGNIEHILAQWRYPVALHDALDLLYQAMRTKLHWHIAMAIFGCLKALNDRQKVVLYD